MGTKEHFRAFLNGKGLTYTRYTKLDPSNRKGLWQEYEGRGRKATKPPQPDKTATEETQPVEA